MGLVESSYKKELKAIKARARGRVTSYTLGRKSGLALLQKYFRLREWILNGEECESLFFLALVPGFPPLPEEFMTKFFKRLCGRYLPSSATNITAAAARKYKSLILHELNLAHDLIADSLNHTKSVNFSAYTSTKIETQSNEFRAFWKAVREARVKIEDVSGHSISTATGHCDGFQRPEELIAGTAVTPNCHTQYGCLFCIHYLCHADEEDVHKLLSLQYVVDAVRRFSPNISHSERLFQELSIRIGAVVDSVESRSQASFELVSDVRRKVYSLGILTPFWERRLSQYEQLGVVR